MLGGSQRSPGEREYVSSRGLVWETSSSRHTGSPYRERSAGNWSQKPRSYERHAPIN